MRAVAEAPSRLASRDSAITLAAIAVVVLLCWWYLVNMATDMGADPMDGVTAFRPWAPSYFVMMFLMWTIMMVAMMVPSATPMILLYRQVAKRNRLPHAALRTSFFVSGYLAVWLLFSLAATILQWQLERVALLSPTMRSANLYFSSVVLIGAGLYQWSAWKRACLRHCRGPFFFISNHWRPGLGGAWHMGLVHGAYCLGCCGLLMALLFVGGVMDLLVIALITLVVLLEKLVPGGERLGRALGGLAIVLGIALLTTA